jgi:hypothetical protein
MTDQPVSSIAAGGKETAFPLVLGLDTFGDRTNTADGQPLSHAQTIRNVVEEGVLAEQVGVDFFGISEHHTDYFPMPAGDVVLASIAARTQLDRGAHPTDPPGLRRHCPQLRRPGPGVPALLDFERTFERSG